MTTPATRRGTTYQPTPRDREAMAEANRTGRETTSFSGWTGEGRGGMRREIVAMPGNILMERGTVIYREEAPQTMTPEESARASARRRVEAPWNKRRLKIDLDARLMAHGAKALTVVAFTYVGFQVGQYTGRHFPWMIVGAGLGDFLGGIVFDKVELKFSDESEDERDARDERAAAVAQQVYNPYFGGRTGAAQSPDVYGPLTSRDQPLDTPAIIRSTER